MVGFGSSLRMARRSGWERAYLDYETLKMLLSQIEAVYEEEGHRDADSSVTSTHKRGDYRDDLFLEGDSDVAFASSNGSDDSDDDDKINNNNDRNRRYPLTFTSHESTDEDDDQVSNQPVRRGKIYDCFTKGLMIGTV